MTDEAYARYHKWPLRFMDLAALVASWSKDPSTKCGAVIVRRDRTIVSVGYNGFPRNMDDGPELYADREVKYQRVIHAEMNAILNARGSVHDCTLYTWPFPTCDRCAAMVIQAGISEVRFPRGLDFPARWQDSVNRAIAFYDEAGVHVGYVQTDEGNLGGAPIQPWGLEGSGASVPGAKGSDPDVLPQDDAVPVRSNRDDPPQD